MGVEWKSDKSKGRIFITRRTLNTLFKRNLDTPQILEPYSNGEIESPQIA